MISSLALLQRLQKQGVLSKEAAAEILKQRDQIIKRELSKEAASIFSKLRRGKQIRKKLKEKKRPVSVIDRIKTPDKTPFPSKKKTEETSRWSDVTLNLGKLLALAGMTAGASAGISGVQNVLSERALRSKLEDSFQGTRRMVRGGEAGNPNAVAAMDMEPGRVRQYFDTFARYAPTLASDPIVATSYIRSRADTPFVAVDEIARLAEMERAVRRAKEDEARKSSLNPFTVAGSLLA